jgi:hypothetical protein
MGGLAPTNQTIQNGCMRIIRRSLPVLLDLSVLGLLVLGIASPVQFPGGFDQVLNKQALASLRADCDVLVTGQRPADGLVPRLNGWSGTYLTGDERIDGHLRLRASGLKLGIQYTGVEVTLTPSSVEWRGNKVILHARDAFTEHRQYDFRDAAGLPTETRGITNHDFVFSVARARANAPPGPYSIQAGGLVYTLVLDVNEPQLLLNHDASHCCDDDEPPFTLPAPGALENKTVPQKLNRGHQAALLTT